jgi:hypothetical protein
MTVRKALVLGCILLGGVGFGSLRAAYAADAKLYEVTENMKLQKVRESRNLHRMAFSALSGTAKAGTPLCPLSVGVPSCVVNVTGNDDVDAVTGLGKFKGKWVTVVPGDNSVDAPELEVASGKFDGLMDFSPALVYSLPYGTVTGTLQIDKDRTAYPFTGVFYLPFIWPGDPSQTPLYLGPDGSLVPVQPDEYSLSYPTVKFEITFQ